MCFALQQRSALKITMLVKVQRVIDQSPKSAEKAIDPLYRILGTCQPITFLAFSSSPWLAICTEKRSWPLIKPLRTDQLRRQWCNYMTWKLPGMRRNQLSLTHSVHIRRNRPLRRPKVLQLLQLLISFLQSLINHFANNTNGHPPNASSSTILRLPSGTEPE